MEKVADFSCKLLKEITVSHVPITPKEETVLQVLRGYDLVSLGEKERPASLMLDYTDFRHKYDGQLVPITFSLFQFSHADHVELPEQRISGQKIVDEVREKYSARQVKGYELALLGCSPEYLEFVQGRFSDQIQQIMAISISDAWPGEENTWWVSCVDTAIRTGVVRSGEGRVKKTFRHFFAGNDPLIKRYPIDGCSHLIVGIRD